ncbi:MAG: TetR/AcrR family transcriptional regulator [Ilumatobacter sp.]|uniref:TetR/AcrR family transcriptional regulator n=1 Tax=Ilumatobacter sp. TaxID=1967498 RepID=UPI002626DA30|nr:TetR/AcrR family transcriptional regulator [Ilumatobacter sp.]MDJ0767852.1 TetR/AcrR family transcriptional regulator [Ilumatobacter sp.]
MNVDVRRSSGDTAVFAVAERIVRDEGPHALSVRRIADEAGTSTQAIYTEFGGKPGLADALYREGYARLADRLERLDRSAPVLDRIRRLGEAYRDNALENPHLYDLMTAHPLPEYEPPPASRGFARTTLQPLIDAVADAVEAGELAGDAERIAHEMWASGHGVLSLTIHGLLSRERAITMIDDMTEMLLGQHAPATQAPSSSA